MKKYRVDFEISYEVEAESKNDAMQKAETELREGVNQIEPLTDLFGCNAEEIKESE